jgi:phosphoglycolate phosphatase
MPLPYPKAVLFDLDGTLADTAPDLANAVNRLRVSRGLHALPYEVLRPVASAGARGLVGVAFGIGADDQRYVALRDEFLKNYETDIAVDSRLFDGIAPLLLALENAGIAWGIVTNKIAHLTGLLVPQIGLAHAACMVSGDTTPFSKPHPAPLIEACKQMNIRPEDCWYVGDDLRDIQAGVAAGMTTVAAGWGYCGDTPPAAWEADAVANSPSSLLHLIEQAGLESPTADAI